MYIVRFNLGKKHSVWNTEKEAEKQIEVLEGCGYKNCFWEFLNCEYENGHYFV